MGSASLEFIGFSLLVAVVYNLSRAVAWRQSILLLASLAFLSFFSLNAITWLPLAAFLAFGFLSIRLIQSGRNRTLFLLLLVAGILAFIWLKKYTFLPEALFLKFPYVTLGLSYIFFRVLHLIIDAKDGAIPQKIGIVSYLNYTLNFTTLVSGPIQRYQDFAEMELAASPLSVDVTVFGKAFERIIIGFFKVNVLSLAFSALQSHALSSLASQRTFSSKTLGAVVIAASYPLYLYCNFSGYIDIVIGIARLLRIELPENFNRPFSSDNFMNFWSRWHITLSEWLKNYVYNPLLIGLMRKYPSPAIGPFLGVFAFFVTFFLVGVWHGQTSVFLFFGVLQGLGVSVTKLYQILMGNWLGRKQYRALSNGAVYNVLARGLTFTWFTFTLLWFWSNWRQLGTIVHQLDAGSIAAAWLVIFFGSAVLLALWELVRAWLLSFQWENQPLLLSRYVRTVWDTALVVIALATVMLLNAPAPDIVYKAF
jgi:D-alanyl-lipoteichoic acid acyltransferase DltB (MBOAT superfamily)